MRSATLLGIGILGATCLAGCGHDAKPGPTPVPCTYAVSASPASFPSGGGSGTLTITTGGACSWSARASAGWLTLTSTATGTGAGSVTFSVAANDLATRRSGAVTVEDRTATIDQDAAAEPCSYTIAPSGASMGKDGGGGTFAVVAGPSCAWASVSDSPWLTITSGASGTGHGAVAYSASRNDQPSARSGTIRLAGLTFTLAQAGDESVCQYSVAPVEFSPCMGSVELASEVIAQAGCPWTASPAASWITVTTGSSGSGSATVRFKIGDNWDAPRTGSVQIRWPTPTAGQNLRIVQAGCYYAVTREAFSFPATGGNGTFDVVQQSEPYTCGGPTQNACVWSATSDSSWITITSSMPRFGDDRVGFTVSPNTTGASRAGTVTVRGKLVRITQGF